MEIENTSYGQQIDDLLVKEKQARLNNEAPESVKIVTQIVKITWDLKEYEKMFELMILLAKRRGQSKKAQTAMVAQCMEYVKLIDDLPIKLQLIETIKQVCDKKIYLEVEYARCCLLLVKYKEDDDQIEQAASILQEVQVETYGSMDRREKLEFILYQMKIMIKKKDYIRLYIISKKINEKNLELKEILDLKITFYAYMIEYHNHENNYLECSHCYKKIFETLDAQNQSAEKLKEEEKEEKEEKEKVPLPTFVEYGYNTGLKIDYQQILEGYILYLAIAPHSSSKSAQLAQLQSTHSHKLEKFPHLKHLIQQLLLQELISTSIPSYNLQNALIFQAVTENHTKHAEALRKQLVQKNITVLNQYYLSLTLDRLAEMLAVSVQEAEENLCEMINEKLIYARIDRLEGTVVFKIRQSENQVLNSWSQKTNQVVELIETTCNLIKQQEEEIAAK